MADAEQPLPRVVWRVIDDLAEWLFTRYDHVGGLPWALITPDRRQKWLDDATELYAEQLKAFPQRYVAAWPEPDADADSPAIAGTELDTHTPPPAWGPKENR